MLILEPKNKAIKVSEIAKHGVKGAKVVKQKETPEYKKLVQEANKRIEEDQRRLARAAINAENFIAL